MKTTTQLLMIAAFVLLAAVTLARQPEGDGPGEGAKGEHVRGPAGPGRRMMFEQNFFEPELVMQNQGAIGLTDEQTSAIRGHMRTQMATFMDLQWQLNAEEEAFAAILKEARIDETKATAQLDRMMRTENEMKRLRMMLLVKVKNVLTAQQQETLRTLFRESGPMRQQKPMPGMPQQEIRGPRGPQIMLPGEQGVQAPQGRLPAPGPNGGRAAGRQPPPPMQGNPPDGEVPPPPPE